MENYICINGKKTELTEEQIKALGIKLPKTPSSFDRVREGQTFYYIGSDSNVGVTKECYSEFDNSCYRHGNYCTDNEILGQRALYETLNRLLWRYSMEHKGKVSAYGITVRLCWGSWIVLNLGFDYNIPGVVYFDNEEIASSAIKEVIEPFMKAHPEFEWQLLLRKEV